MIICKTEMNNGIAKILSSVLLLIGQVKILTCGFWFEMLIANAFLPFEQV